MNEWMNMWWWSARGEQNNNKMWNPHIYMYIMHGESNNRAETVQVEVQKQRRRRRTRETTETYVDCVRYEEKQACKQENKIVTYQHTACFIFTQTRLCFTLSLSLSLSLSLTADWHFWESKDAKLFRSSLNLLVGLCWLSMTDHKLQQLQHRTTPSWLVIIFLYFILFYFIGYSKYVCMYVCMFVFQKSVGCLVIGNNNILHVTTVIVIVIIISSSSPSSSWWLLNKNKIK